MCVTGLPERMKNTTGRIIILTSYMTSLVLMAAYSAFLISSLALQHRDLPFRDFLGLLHDGSYRLGVMRNTSYFNKFNVWEEKIFLTRLFSRYFWGEETSWEGLCPLHKKIYLKHVYTKLTVLRTIYHSTSCHIITLTAIYSDINLS